MNLVQHAVRATRKTYQCPDCHCVLTNAVVKEYDSPRELSVVHLLGGMFVKQFAVAMVAGECRVHGFVKTEDVR